MRKLAEVLGRFGTVLGGLFSGRRRPSHRGASRRLDSRLPRLEWLEQRRLLGVFAADDFGDRPEGPYPTHLAGGGSGDDFVASDAYRQKLIGSGIGDHDRFGYAVAVSGNVAIVGAQEDDGTASLTGTAFIYRYDGSSWTEEQKLYDPAGEIGDRLGNAVAIEGSVAVVCAEKDDNANGRHAGSAFVFRYNGTSWALEQQLIASDGQAYDRLGCSAAIDGNVIVVGAREKDAVDTNSGGAYVFRYNGSQWVEEAALEASDGQVVDEFGSGVDVDGNTIMVGAPGDRIGSSDPGSVYVYTYNGTNWGETDWFHGADYDDLDQFGTSVSLEGDLAVVGAARDEDYVIGNGAAYVFHFNGTRWVEQQKLYAPDPRRDAHFGQSVSLSGETIVVGAPGDVFDRGAVYVYSQSGSEWVETRKVVGDAPEDADLFGCSVSVSGEQVFVGAYYDSQYADIAGAAYVYGANDPQTINIGTPGAKIFGSDTDGFDRFGYAVAVSGNVAIVGAQGDEETPVSGGSAFIYRYDGSSWEEEQKLYDPSGENGDRLGTAVAIEGNVAVVCADSDNNTNGQAAGSAFVFRHNGASWVLEQQLIASDGQAFDRFGCSVAVEGNVIVVGAWEKDAVGTNSGGAYVFRYNGSEWIEEAALEPSDKESGDEFGSAVDVDGNTIMVGAQEDPIEIWGSGSVYVYTYNGASWIETQRFYPADYGSLDYFGNSLSLDGEYAIVGAVQKDDVVDSNGAAYVFRFNGAQWVEHQSLRASDPSYLGYFGRSVSLSGHLAAVGSEGGVYDTGAVYLYALEGAEWVEKIKYVGGDPQRWNRLGYSVSISGTTVWAGAWGDRERGTSNAGAAYVIAADAAQPADFGDAPAPYATLLASNGPSHVAGGPMLGANRDAEGDGLPTPGADGDDVDNTDDEDGLNNPAVDLALTIGSQPTVDVSVTNTTGSAATLYGWIDYNGDGLFDNATERASAVVADGTAGGSVTLTFPAVPAGSAAGTYARFRLSTDSAAQQPTGPAADGEVEDYQVSISGLDFGDAPDTGAGTGPGNYKTLSTDGGPSHAIVPGVFMGTIPDGEAEAVQSAGADGDDNSDTDDEDGLVDPAGDLTLTVGVSPTVDVSVTNNTGTTALLVGWIDYNGDGVFDNFSERALVAVPTGTFGGTFTLTFPPVPEDPAANTYARLRLSTDAAAAEPTGAASNGEVEDYPASTPAAVVDGSRRIFYDNSYWDGNTAGPNTTGGPGANGDDGAIATDKSALLPGGTATAANFTTYDKGVNGIMVDVAGLADPTAVSDNDFSEFAFRVGNDNNPSGAGWTDAAAPTDVAVRDLGGGIHRVSFFWAAGAIPTRNWLQLTLKADAATGLAQDDVFYFGSAVGDANLDCKTLYDDIFAIYSNVDFVNFKLITEPCDVNRDGKVLYDDIFACYSCVDFTNQLVLITPPVSPSAPGVGAGVPMSGEMSWAAQLGVWEQSSRRSDDSEEEESETAADAVFAAYGDE